MDPTPKTRVRTPDDRPHGRGGQPGPPRGGRRCDRCPAWVQAEFDNGDLARVRVIHHRWCGPPEVLPLGDWIGQIDPQQLRAAYRRQKPEPQTSTRRDLVSQTRQRYDRHRR